MRRLAVLLLLLVAACGSVGASAHAIALAYKAGDVYKYALHMSLKYTIAASGISIPLEMDMSAKETSTVKSVDSTGTADITVDLTDMTMKMTMAGTTNSTNTTTPTSIEMKVASDGHIVSVNGNALGSNAFPSLGGMQGGLVSAILPDKPVKPGDTWSKSYDQPNPMGSGTSHVTTDNTYTGDEKVGSVNANVVVSKIKATLDLTLDLGSIFGGTGMPAGPAAGPGGSSFQGLTIKGTARSDVKSWIEPGSRHLVKTHSTGTLDATMTVNLPSPSAGGATATTPGLSGPITFKGTQALDLNPA